MENFPIIDFFQKIPRSSSNDLLGLEKLKAILIIDYGKFSFYWLCFLFRFRFNTLRSFLIAFDMKFDERMFLQFPLQTDGRHHLQAHDTRAWWENQWFMASQAQWKFVFHSEIDWNEFECWRFHWGWWVDCLVFEVSIWIRVNGIIMAIHP